MPPSRTPLVMVFESQSKTICLINQGQQGTSIFLMPNSGGWLHTGDQARIEDGRIFITGRIKDILVTSTGEKIAPVDLETTILADPLFEQAMVVGDNRRFSRLLSSSTPRPGRGRRPSSPRARGRKPKAKPPFCSSGSPTP